MLVIRQFTESDKNAWDTYVQNHPQATFYHLSGWKSVIKKAYGHKSYYLMAAKEKLGSREAVRLGSKNQLEAENQLPPSLPGANHYKSNIDQSSRLFSGASQHRAGNITGILPLVHLKHFLFSNSLISIPFFDYGGILADDRETEKALINEAVKIGRKIRAEIIELRQIKPLSWMNDEFRTNSTSNSIHSVNTTNLYPFKSFAKDSKANFSGAINWTTKSTKVRMMLGLPSSSGELMKSFKSKLRSQIRKPLKEGLTAAVGGVELIDDFYMVFAQNMRDLGSPVHSKRLIKSVFDIYPKESRIVVIYQDRRPLACSFVAGFNNTLENPWASSSRKYSKLAPNMLLYWTMLEYACDRGYTFFDFGRSTPNEGTFKFKSQWGAEPIPLHWYYIATGGNKLTNSISESQTYGKAVELWKKLPVSVSKIVGPPIRKYIGL